MNENLKRPAKRRPVTGKDGQLRVRNLSAYWIPELTVTEVIHGAAYTVTGSYEGTESFLKKLERITAKKAAENLEKPDDK